MPIWFDRNSVRLYSCSKFGSFSNRKGCVMEYRFEVSEEEIAACADWHGGQFSMLYAIASTGSLSLGERYYSRWYDDDERTEMFIELMEDLNREINYTISHMNDTDKHAEHLRSLMYRTNDWLVQNAY